MSKNTNVNLIGISGKIGSGKDTVGAILQVLKTAALHDSNAIARIVANPFLMSSVQSQFDNWKIKKFAKKVKLIAELLTGIPVEKFEDQEFKLTNLPPEWSVNNTPMTVRELLQKIGTDCMRNNLHSQTWVNALFSDYKPDEKWLITDVRFLNEAVAIKKRGGMIIRVDRGLDTGTHPSETELDKYNFDYVIPNKQGLRELIKEVKKFAIFNGQYE
jgi:hypothetical protein